LAAGVRDVLITSPPPLWAAARVAALGADGRLAVVADGPELLRALSAAAGASILRIVLDIDLGQHRTGMAPADAPGLARLAATLPGLEVVGLQGYVGHLQHLKDAGAREAANASASARLQSTAAAVRAAGAGISLITGGGTGTYAFDLKGGVFTEVQAGSYALMDAQYGDCAAPGGAAWPFTPALFLAASVVSARHPSHVVVDAGLKALSADGPPARVVAGAPAGSRFGFMGDEHGAVFHPLALGRLSGARDPLAFEAAIFELDETLSWPDDAPRPGDLVWLQPGHCDPTINLHEAVYLATPDGRLERLEIDARRRL